MKSILAPVKAIVRVRRKSRAYSPAANDNEFGLPSASLHAQGFVDTARVAGACRASTEAEHSALASTVPTAHHEAQMPFWRREEPRLRPTGGRQWPVSMPLPTPAGLHHGADHRTSLHPSKASRTVVVAGRQA